MKSILMAFCLIFCLPHFSIAQELEATSIHDLVTEIEASDFVYKERGMIFGYFSIQSCLYVSRDIIIIKNYCFPQSDYPARGLTIISKEFGMIDLYEEQYVGVLKRDIQITEFPKSIAPYLGFPFPQMNIASLSSIIEKLYYQNNPACWSTNHSSYSEAPEVGCASNGQNVNNFDLWKEETQAITGDLKSWTVLMDSINSKLQ